MARLGEMLGFGDNPFYKAFDSNRNAFTSAFANMGADPLNPWAGWGQGFQRGSLMDVAEQDKAAQQAQLNQTTEWLKANYPQFAGLPPAQGFDAAMKLMGQQGTGSGGGADERFFGNVVPMQDAEGNIVLGQASNMGNWQPLQGADGYSPAPTTKQIDTGTEIITTDIYGNELYRTPKQNRQAAYETGYGGVEGKADAENAALAESVQSKLPGLRTVIDELTSLADTATYTQSGQAMDAVKRELGLPVGQGAIDRASYIAIVDNQVLPLLRDTFGAAFTQKEGESLRATLGDPNKSPAEKKAILNAFIAQKERDVAAMHSRFPGQGGEIDDILSGYGL